MILSDGSQIVAYCANPGSLQGCLKAGSRALLWDSGSLTRKRRYTWRGIESNSVWVGTDTHLANRLVEKVLSQRLLPGLKRFTILEREKLVGKNLRLDFFLLSKKRECFIEVKSATVVEQRIARYPDSVTPRGLRHLKALTNKASAGHKAVLIFVSQRGDAVAFKVNDACYPAYARAFKRAVSAGVKIMALAFTVRPEGYLAPRLLPVL